MGQDWARCQRMIQHEKHRYEELKNLTTPINLQPLQDYINVQWIQDAQAGTTNADIRPAFRAIEQVLQDLSILQKKYMLHLNLSELDLFIRILLGLKFKTRGRAKLHALVEELQQYNDCIERRHDRLVASRPPQNPIPQWPPPVQRYC